MATIISECELSTDGGYCEGPILGCLSVWCRCDVETRYGSHGYDGLTTLSCEECMEVLVCE